MKFESTGNGFQEATPAQLRHYADRIVELTPLLSEHSIDMEDLECPFPDLPIGESLIMLTDEGTEDDVPTVLGQLTVKNLGGIIELGDGVTMPSDPTRITDEICKGAFAIDDKVVVVDCHTNTEQNLRYEEDVTVSRFMRTTVISRVVSDEHEFWFEQLYDYGAEKASYHELLYRKSKNKDDEWVHLAAPSWAHLLNGTEPSEEELAAKADQTQENPNRFDQNRFAAVMGMLDKVNLDNRLDQIPTLGQSAFKVVLS